MQHSTDPIARIVKETESRLKDARYRAPGSNADAKIGPRSHPERYTLEAAGEALGLTGYDPTLHEIERNDKEDVKAFKREAGAHGKKEFYEMNKALKEYDEAAGPGHGVALKNSTAAVEQQVGMGAARPQLGSDGDWKGIFFSALRTLLRETIYTRDPKQREDHLKHVHRWFKEKQEQFDRVDENRKHLKNDGGMARTTLRGFGASRATRNAGQGAHGDSEAKAGDGAGSANNWGDAPSEAEMSKLSLGGASDHTSNSEAASTSTLTVEGELSRFRTRDLTSSYRKRLETHLEHAAPAPNAKQWSLPPAKYERITPAAKAVYGDPSTWVVPGHVSAEDQSDFHARHVWLDADFDQMSADEQRRKAPTRPFHKNDEELPQTARTAVTAAGAEKSDQNVPVRRARPQTAPTVPKKNVAEAAKWRAQHNFTYYTPSDDPKELAMHDKFASQQADRFKSHRREVEMSEALTGWAVRRARINEEITRRQEAVQWSMRSKDAMPTQRILDVNADSEDDDGIEDDESDTEFGAEEAPVGGQTSPGGTKQRPKSRGATWLSSYHEKSFHRIEYSKPKPQPRPPPVHRPVYVQRPESAATEMGGRPGSAFINKRPSTATKEPAAAAGEEGDVVAPYVQHAPSVLTETKAERPSSSSLPTKPRPMSATEYNKAIRANMYDNKGKFVPPDPKGPGPNPLQKFMVTADSDWIQDQTEFSVAQSLEVQGVREAFMRQGQRVSMATIEKALSVPKERTFAECISAMRRQDAYLPSDPSKKAKKKGKKKKKKK